jgi:peroxiredoxin
MEYTMKDLTGKPAVPFNLRDSEGHTHHLENYKGNWLLMVFHRHLG